MDKEIKDRIDKRTGYFDHIGWRGICSRCGSNRYVFYDEMRHSGIGPHEDLRDMEFECKGARCKRMVVVKGKMNPFKACHLNDIRRRETDVDIFKPGKF